MMIRTRRAAVACRWLSGGMASFVGLTPAMAQETPPADTTRQGPMLEEVVVAAQRRLESVQDVPIAISALSAESLEARGITSTIELNAATPALVVTEFIKAPTVFLRGLGTTSTVPGQEQNVAVYVDGVYYASMIASAASFNNLDRIEVLKGPQGTLFGRNTTGGLMHIITKDPSSTPSGRLSVGYGNFDTTRVSAYGTTGIGEHVAADLSVMWTDQGEGWGRNLFDGREVSKRQEKNVRTKWVIEPSDSTKITLSGSYIDGEGDMGIARQVLEGTPVLPPNFGSAQFTGSIYDINANTRAVSETEQRAASIRLDQDLGFARLVGIGGWQKVVNHTQYDFDGTPGNMRVATWDPDKSESYTGEIQLLAPDDSKLRWIAGLFYFHSMGYHDLTLTGAAYAAPQFINVDGSTDTDSYSAFAQATYPLTDTTNLTLGARYTIDQKNIHAAQNTALARARQDSNKDWGNGSYRLALDHWLTDDIMVYASVNTGFKSGLYNLTSPLTAPVDPEELLAYEIGAKSTLFDRVRLNVASFYYDYTDIQTTRIVATTSVLQNAAGAELYGLEADIEAAVTDRLQVRSGFSWMQTKYTSFPDAASNVPVNGIGQQRVADVSGNDLPRAPEFTANFGIEYRQPTSFGEIGVDTNYYYNGGFYWEPDNRLEQKAYHLLSAGVSWTAPSEIYSLRLWINNALDEEYLAYVASASGGPDLGAAAAPRTYGITIDFRL